MGLERAHDLEGLRHDANDAICTTEEDALRSGCYARDIANLQVLMRQGRRGRGRGHTSDRKELSSSGSLTCETSKKRNCHFSHISIATRRLEG